jgi:hypothetical protein
VQCCAPPPRQTCPTLLSCSALCVAWAVRAGGGAVAEAAAVVAAAGHGVRAVGCGGGRAQPWEGGVEAEGAHARCQVRNGCVFTEAPCSPSPSSRACLSAVCEHGTPLIFICCWHSHANCCDGPSSPPSSSSGGGDDSRTARAPATSGGGGGGGTGVDVQ